MRIGSLCSGIGGLELGLERAGIGETVWQAEIDPHASEVLARHWPGVPNLGNFVGADLPPADVICGGFPCQPVSTAGRRKGTDDERWLFDDIADAVGRMDPRPRLLVFENVRGLLSANGGDAMARVVHGLARLSYVGRYGLLRASDVGAPHQRARLFVAAYAVDFGAHRAVATTSGGGRPADGGVAPTDPDGQGSQGRAVLRERGGERITGSGGAGADGVRTRWGPYRPAIERWEAIHGPAPAPTVDGRLSPAFVCWMQGFPPGWVDGLTRTAALRCLGNAVVPQVAERFGRMVLGEVGGPVVPLDTLLPTPTSTHPGGSLEDYHGRLTDREATFTPLNMLVEQVLA